MCFKLKNLLVLNITNFRKLLITFLNELDLHKFLLILIQIHLAMM